MIIQLLACLLALVYGAIVWRLRGGAWATLLNIHMGTTLTRLVTGALLGAICMWFQLNAWLFLAMIVSWWLGLVLAGWGPFMGMGDHAWPPARTWIEIFPRMLGLVPQSVAWDYVGMLACGVLLYTPVVTVFVGLFLQPLVLILIPVFACLFATTYLIISKIPSNLLPVIPGFTTQEHETWSEVVVGTQTAALLILACVICI